MMNTADKVAIVAAACPREGAEMLDGVEGAIVLVESVEGGVAVACGPVILLARLDPLCKKKSMPYLLSRQ